MTIVKNFDVLKNGLMDLLKRLVRVPIFPFSSERSNEALSSGVVVAIALATHAHLDSSLCEQSLVAGTCVLTASVSLTRRSLFPGVIATH
ncbi:MAG TPA: hypothetical protein VEI53_11585 [Ktedonobacteraceae bacterium]|nr:hypothetical protein [Ktedonobacteraceae bacterium]